MSNASSSHGAADGILQGAVAVLILVLIVQNGFDAFLLGQQKSLLKAQIESQQPAMAQGARMRNQLEEIAGQTAALSAGGNQNAREIIAEFGAAGINIHAARSGGGN